MEQTQILSVAQSLYDALVANLNTINNTSYADTSTQSRLAAENLAITQAIGALCAYATSRRSGIY